MLTPRPIACRASSFKIICLAGINSPKINGNEKDLSHFHYTSK